MNVMELSIIALALALDASLYAFGYGLVLRSGRVMAALRLAFIAAMFQGVMPVLGYASSLPLREMLAQSSGLLLLIVFCGLGGAMLYKTFFGKPDELPVALGFASVLLVGLLTSIDAFLLGGCISLSQLAQVDCLGDLMLACLLIAVITFVMTLLFFAASGLFQKLPTRLLESLAGLLLIGLGLHYWFQ